MMNMNRIFAKLGLAVCVLCLGFLRVNAQTAVTPAGTGTSGDPYQITLLGNLVWMGSNVAASSGKYYRLMNDVDASSTTNWNDSGTSTSVLEGFKPIGDFNGNLPFSGLFDGNNHKITGLAINRPGVKFVGLFSYIGTSGSVLNLGVEGLSLTASGRVGGLAGENDGFIGKCYVTGSVGGGDMERVGGLVGNNWTTATISNCYAGCTVTGSSNSVGGLVAYNAGIITNCYATGVVTGQGYYVGGLVGLNYTNIIGCHADGNVSGNGTDTTWGASAGGLVGGNNGLISSCYATGKVSGQGFGVGGLVGYNLAPVSNSYASGNVTGQGLYVGGLVGINYTNLTSCHAHGNVVGNGNDVANGARVGGLVGNNQGQITNCHATGSVSSQGFHVGGLGGINYALIVGSHAEGSVTGNCINASWGSSAGGMAGCNNGSISNCYAIGAVQGQDAYVGGLVGWNTSLILGCQAGGDVVCYGNNTTNGSCAGGLVGYNVSGITNCSAGGAVQGAGFGVGGLVGWNQSPLVGCRAVGNVTGNGTNAAYGSCAGGLAGYNQSFITNCFAAGTVYGLSFDVGGLVGFNSGSGSVAGCLATGEVSAVGDVANGSEVGGLVGKNYSTSTIINSLASGKVTGQNDGVGGLVGANSGLVSGCSAGGNIIGNGNATYGARAGGLVGDNNGPVTNCYATGNVQGQYGNSGGLVGITFTNIMRCYSAGLVSGSGNVGGLVGNCPSGTVTASYWDTQTSGQSTSAGSTASFGKNTVQMKQQATFSGWDFVNVWGITETQTYPFFKATPGQQSYAFAPLITTTNPLPLRATGQAFTQALSARGGTTPYTWTLASGSLPSGLSLNTNGVISGTPSVMTNMSFIVQVAGSNGLVSVKTFSLSTVTPGNMSGQSYAAGGFQLSVTGASGSQYAVQVSTNLIDWTALQTNYSPFVFTDTNSSSYPRRFYRTIYLP